MISNTWAVSSLSAISRPNARAARSGCSWKAPRSRRDGACGAAGGGGQGVSVVLGLGEEEDITPSSLGGSEGGVAKGGTNEARREGPWHNSRDDGRTYSGVGTG